MRKQFSKLAFLAALGLALALTFSCSSGDDNSGGSGINTRASFRAVGYGRAEMIFNSLHQEQLKG